jgi:hypothetical protein
MKIVCSAVQLFDESQQLQVQLVGVRHWDASMHSQYKMYVKSHSQESTPAYAYDVQGFLTSEDTFVDRQEAYEIALSNNQIIADSRIRYDGSGIPQLYSENLY